MIDQIDCDRWSLPVRVIHLLLAVAVTVQLFIGSFMRSPHPGRADTLGFVSHEVMGAVILALVIAHWAWSLSHPGEGVRQLFPWTRNGLRRVAAELWQSAQRRRLPPGGPQDRGLAAFIHGLGLLAVTATVFLGGTFFIARSAGAGRPTLEFIEDVHDIFAIATWIYWGGHLGATLLHSVMHQSVWRDMFTLKG